MITCKLAAATQLWHTDFVACCGMPDESCSMRSCSPACQELISTASSAYPLLVAAWHAASGLTTGVALPAVPVLLLLMHSVLRPADVQGSQGPNARVDCSHCPCAYAELPARLCPAGGWRAAPQESHHHLQAGCRQQDCAGKLLLPLMKVAALLWTPYLVRPSLCFLGDVARPSFGDDETVQRSASREP